ncbi:hypothetical protein CMI37_06440 [Candidatus Pacearchaeota archaeon]|jgi:hypothetical protein|nr:hypothetical protein [Candidatus Pacearchaeota archaeon]|tara:strand:+ start:20 stop:805 length:786 start_codon:yes stop_codon:yes gene_type:complete
MVDPNDYESNMELSGSEAPKEETPKEEAPTPEEPKPEEAPADPTPESTPEETPKEESPKEEAPEVILYDTPDGRKLTAEQLQTEWKDNFLPEFTRKSQALADFEREKEINSTPKDEPKWKQEGYVPEDYAEVIEIAKAEAMAEINSNAKAEADRVAAIKTGVENELKELKAIDKDLDENALFQHANKYQFQSLKTAHANMTDMKKSVVDTEQRTVKNLNKREADPISTGPGAEAPDSSGYDPVEMSQFDGAAEYLSHLKGK